MTETVLLAIIGTFRSWGEMFVQNLAVIVPSVVGAAILWMQRRNNQRSERRSDEIKCEVATVKQVAALSDEHAELIAKGAERKGVETGIDIGVEKERKRASQPATLRADFQPESTDVFMMRTDGTDQNRQR